MFENVELTEVSHTLPHPRVRFSITDSENVFENRTRLPENNRFSGTLRLICESVFENSTRFSKPVVKFQSGTLKSRLICSVIRV
jgi:hypothetical protein